MDTIRLLGMSFYGYHGTDAEENHLGQRFLIDVEMHVDLARAGETDAISDSVNYADVFEIVRQVAEGSPVKLLERLAALINGRVLDKYPQVMEISTTVHKPGAPIRGILADVSVTLNKKR